MLDFFFHRIVGMVNNLTEKNLDKNHCITEVQVIINSNVILNTVRTTDYTIMV